MNDSTQEPELADEPQRFRRVAALQGFLERNAWLLPVGSFAVGWIGFVLVQRGADLARWVAVLALVGWPWLLIEPFVRRALMRWRRSRLPNVVVNFISQSIQQELLFFSLPLMLGATSLDLGQCLFAGFTIAAALVSTIDPVYERHVAARPVVRLAFHAWCSWVAALVVLPIVAKIPLERALPASLLMIGVWIVVGIPKILTAPVERRQKVAALAVLLAAPPLLWLSRSHIPAAGLSVREAVIARSIEELVPGPKVKELNAAELQSGVVAFVAIRAPMGVAQSVVFAWCHKRSCEYIPAEVRGTEGYWRTFSRKQNFPADPLGRWTVDVQTPQGQLLERMVFHVR